MINNHANHFVRSANDQGQSSSAPRHSATRDNARPVARANTITREDYIENVIAYSREQEMRDAARNPVYQAAVAKVDDVQSALVAIERARESRNQILKMGCGCLVAAGGCASFAAWLGCSMGVTVGAGIAPLVLFTLAALHVRESRSTYKQSLEQAREDVADVGNCVESLSAPILSIWRESLEEFCRDRKLPQDLRSTYEFVLQLLDTQLNQLEATRRHMAVASATVAFRYIGEEMRNIR